MLTQPKPPGLLLVEPRLLVIEPRRRFEEAERRVLYEQARAMHGGLWRDTAGGRELEQATRTDTEYNKGVEALGQFTQQQQKPLNEMGLVCASLMHVVHERKTNGSKFSKAVADTFGSASFDAAHNALHFFRLYEESEGKLPAWKLYAVVGSVAAMIMNRFAYIVLHTSHFTNEERLEEAFNNLLDGVWWHRNFLATAAMQMVCTTVLDVARHQFAEDSKSYRK